MMTKKKKTPKIRVMARKTLIEIKDSKEDNSNANSTQAVKNKLETKLKENEHSDEKSDPTKVNSKDGKVSKENTTNANDSINEKLTTDDEPIVPTTKSDE